MAQEVIDIDAVDLGANWAGDGSSPYIDATDASYIYTDGSKKATTNTLTFENHSTGAGAINSVTISVRAKSGAGGGDLNVSYSVNGGVDWAGSFNLLNFGVDYGTQTSDDLSATFDTWAKIDAAAVKLEGQNSTEVDYVDHIYMTIDYTSSSSSSSSYSSSSESSSSESSSSESSSSESSSSESSSSGSSSSGSSSSYSSSSFSSSSESSESSSSESSSSYSSSSLSSSSESSESSSSESSSSESSSSLSSESSSSESSSSFSSSSESSSSESSESSSSESSSSYSSSSESSSSESSESSESSSSSSSSATPGNITWGHHTGVLEPYDENFTGNWTGGAIGGAAGNDNETITLYPSESTESEDWYVGAKKTVLIHDEYGGLGAGPEPTLYYKTAANKAGLVGAGWNLYNGAFDSLGWVKAKIEY